MSDSRHLLFLFAGLLIPVFLMALDVTLAEIYQYNPEGSLHTDGMVTVDLFKSLLSKNIGQPIHFSLTESADPPKSILEAAALSSEESRDILMYGFVKITDRYYDLEIKLYDSKAGKIQKVFYAKNSRDEYEILISTISDRIMEYFCKMTGIPQEKKEAAKEYGVLAGETGLGYWFSFEPWRHPLMGIGSLHASGSLTPVSPLFTGGIFSFSLSYGISLEYDPGINREGYESFLFHTLRFGLPVTLSARWYSRNRVILQVTPGLQLDILVQDRLYGNTVTEKSGAFSLSGALGYEYIFGGNNFSLGGMMRFHTAFYTDVLFILEPALYVRYRLIRKRSEP